jgi:hypothetical protein
MHGRRSACRILVGKPEGKNCCEDLDVNGRLMLMYVLEE